MNEKYTKKFADWEIDPPRTKTPDDAPLMICECGWRGGEYETRLRDYDSGYESWQRSGGRRGYHWHCPECDAVIWYYYYMIN